MTVRTLNPVQSLLVRQVASVLSGSGPNAALLVLTYHRVLAAPDPMLTDEPDAEEFSRQLDLLGAHFNVLPLAEARDRLAAGTLPARAVCITFDDGYANNCEIAVPLLRQKGVPATVFVATGYLDGGRMFNDTVIESVRRSQAQLDLSPLGLGRYELKDWTARRQCVANILGQIKYLDPRERSHKAEQVAAAVGVDLPQDLMMTQAQVRRLADNGIEVGAHTVNHPILTRVSEEEARRELVESKARLEAITGRTVRFFAYPNGQPVRDYDSAHVRLARDAGFELAVATADGAVTRHSDAFQWPRISPWGGSVFRSALRMAVAFGARQQEKVAA